jgi:hypothetical protein
MLYIEQFNPLYMLESFISSYPLGILVTNTWRGRTQITLPFQEYENQAMTIIIAVGFLVTHIKLKYHL